MWAKGTTTSNANVPYQKNAVNQDVEHRQRVGDLVKEVERHQDRAPLMLHVNILPLMLHVPGDLVLLPRDLGS